MMIVLMAALSLLAVAIVLFNRLVRYRMLTREAWSGIGVQLKRRHDLIPNIVESVKGYKQYESKVLADLTGLRSRLDGAGTLEERQGAENDLSRALRSVFALAEAYPDLKAAQGFLDLQKNLVSVEDEIQLARRYYNGTVRDYNIAVESFPGNLLSLIFGFSRSQFFEIEYATERAVPDVKF